MRYQDIFQLLQQQQFDRAAAKLRLHLKKQPHDPNALQILGVVRLNQGRFDEAVEALEQAVHHAPKEASCYNNLALARLRLGHTKAAKKAAQTALRLDQTEAAYWGNLGYIEEQAGNFSDMASAFFQARRRSPEDSEWQLGEVVAYRKMGQSDKAVHLLKGVKEDVELFKERCLVTLISSDGQRKVQHSECRRMGVSLLELADYLAEEGWPEFASHFYREHLIERPDDTQVRYLFAASEGRFDEAAANHYVQSLYDRSAERFEQRLLGNLDYQAPVQLEALLARHDMSNMTNVLDLGCGTGLAGKVIRKANPGIKMTGVDLSVAMLEKAQFKGCYDQVVEADAMAFLASTTIQYDLISLLDVLIYIGDAEALLASACERLSPHGLLLFTIENGAHNQVQINGRVTHEMQTLCNSLPDMGLMECVDFVIRKEKGQDVGGRLVLLSRSGPST